MISATLLIIMRDEDFDLNTLSYSSQLVLVIVGFTFVDDTDIINAVSSVNTTGDDLLKNNKMWSIRGKVH